MKPEIWGKHMWYTVHFIALAYPEQPTSEDKRHYQIFFENLHTVIPCYKCSVNYVKHLNELPIDSTALKSNKGLFEWTVDLHNVVNRNLGKQVWSYEKARSYYTDFSQNNNSCRSYRIANWTLVTFLVLLVIMLIALLFYFTFKFPSELISKAYRT